MAINENYFKKDYLREIPSRERHKAADKIIFLTAAIVFPLIVLIGYSKTYYFSAFFSDVAPIANSLVHLHGIVMSVWVLYFAAQIALVKTKNVKLHMTLGLIGIALAFAVVVVCAATAYDSHIVRKVAPPGMHPYGFLTVPLADLFFFVVFFTGAIYYRKRSVEHKTLMLMTAVNFLSPAIARIPGVPPEIFLFWAFGTPCLVAIGSLVWHSVRHRKINKIFAAAVAIFVISQPLKIMIGLSQGWIDLIASIFG